MERSYANPAAEREYRRMLGNLDRFPIAFTYAGKRYSGLGGLLVLERSTQGGSAGRRPGLPCNWMKI